MVCSWCFSLGSQHQHQFSSISPTLILFHPLSSISVSFIHFHTFSSIFIHFHLFSSTLIQLIHFHPLWSTVIHKLTFHPLSSIFIHFDPFSSFFILFHPFSSFFIPFPFTLPTFKFVGFYCQITADEQGNVNICSSVLIGYNVVVDRKAAAHWSTVWSSGTFSSISGGPRCLKYQNVPKLRSFWPIGKPRSRFQSRVIKVYFSSVPDNHSVPNKTSY